MENPDVDQSGSPEERRLTKSEAKYLSRLAKLDVKRLAGLSVGKAHELLRWRIDPSLLLFRRICGRVVRLNPDTGDYEGVPNATVYVEDTDCSFLGFFPVENPFFWLFPIHCRREVLATVTTDACGEFCVHLPFWDIDRYLRFRRERICFPEIARPNLRDLLRRPLPELRFPKPPFPEPDPPPFRLDSRQIDTIRAYAGDSVVQRLESLAGSYRFSENVSQIDAELDRPLFSNPVPPPIPEELRQSARQSGTKRGIDDVRKAEIPPVDALLQQIDFSRYVGPFWRCRDVWVPVWETVLDIPDLTFRVTQDIDGDGNEETIYSEGFFDVRWNAPSNLNVTLVASEAAISTSHCGPVEGIECQDTPAISTAGYMPLETTHHDDGAGVATRVNRPRPPNGNCTGTQAYPAHAPYTRNLNLHGCHRIGSATHYRLLYAFAASEVGPFTAAVPFAGLTWWAPRLGPGAPIHVVPDATGWYPIPPAGQVAHPNWLLSWPTHRFANGLYEVRVELGAASGGSIAVTQASAPRRFLVDNTRPTMGFDEVRWRPASTSPSTPWTAATLLPDVCPVLVRPAGQDVHLRVVWSASAPHLRNAKLSASGCGAGDLSFVTDAGSHCHWHVDSTDNHVQRTAILLLPGSRPAGCYHLRIDAWGRQFNPSGFDHGPAEDWFIDQGTFGWNMSARAISLVNT
jgi:hypothetical protein